MRLGLSVDLARNIEQYSENIEVAIVGIEAELTCIQLKLDIAENIEHIEGEGQSSQPEELQRLHGTAVVVGTELS